MYAYSLHAYIYVWKHINMCMVYTYVWTGLIVACKWHHRAAKTYGARGGSTSPTGLDQSNQVKEGTIKRGVHRERILSTLDSFNTLPSRYFNTLPWKMGDNVHSEPIRCHICWGAFKQPITKQKHNKNFWKGPGEAKSVHVHCHSVPTPPNKQRRLTFTNQ